MADHKEIQRRTFLAMGGTVAVSALVGAWGLHRYISSFTGGKIINYSANNSATLNSLFERYPEIADLIPWTPLGKFPTPVEELGSVFGLPENQLFVKRDDLSSNHYGGNKVRKLEYLFGYRSQWLYWRTTGS